MAIIVWDFDHTLAYRDGMWTRSLYNILLNNGYTHISEEKIRPHLKNGLPWHRYKESHKDYFNNRTWWEYVNSVIENALLQIGIPKPNACVLANQFKDEYLDISKWYLFDDTLRNLKHSKKLGHYNYILSNHVPELSYLVKELGIQEFFCKIISSAEVGYDKPNKMLFNELEKYLDSKSKRYMIGDNYKADIQGAIKCGYEAVLVRKDNTYNYSRYSVSLDGIWDYITD